MHGIRQLRVNIPKAGLGGDAMGEISLDAGRATPWGGTGRTSATGSKTDGQAYFPGKIGA